MAGTTETVRFAVEFVTANVSPGQATVEDVFGTDGINLQVRNVTVPPISDTVVQSRGGLIPVDIPVGVDPMQLTLEMLGDASSRMLAFHGKACQFHVYKINKSSPSINPADNSGSTISRHLHDVTGFFRSWTPEGQAQAEAGSTPCIINIKRRVDSVFVRNPTGGETQYFVAHLDADRLIKATGWSTSLGDLENQYEDEADLIVEPMSGSIADFDQSLYT